jgi:hypothetical protein
LHVKELVADQEVGVYNLNLNLKVVPPSYAEHWTP